ncbi:MAG: YjgN family protein, partial [Pseudomonas sp.]
KLAEQDESPGTRYSQPEKLVQPVAEASATSSSSAAPASADEAGAANAAVESERFSAREPSGQQQNASLTTRRVEQVRFTGNGTEYFGIWIVNILLMVVTLGFYAPWAKVRNAQYFYGHTELDGSSFQFLADPWVIFRGRLVAIAAVIVWFVATNFFPIFSFVLILLFIPVLPWIVTRSLKFHAVNSAWRNIRFDFKGTYGGACMVIFVWPLVTILTLLLAAPLSVFKSEAWRINNSYFGTTPFHFDAKVSDFFLFFIKLVLIGCGFAVLGMVVGLLSPWLSLPVMIIGYLVLFGYFMAGLTNLVIGSTGLGAHALNSNLGKRQMVWIFFSNSFLIVLTLGLFTPWAKVRMARYKASCTQLEISGDLDHFIAGETKRTSAMGQELGEAFDVGISLI